LWNAEAVINRSASVAVPNGIVVFLVRNTRLCLLKGPKSKLERTRGSPKKQRLKQGGSGRRRMLQIGTNKHVRKLVLVAKPHSKRMEGVTTCIAV
jgi:hypothetical protein